MTRKVTAPRVALAMSELQVGRGGTSDDRLLAAVLAATGVEAEAIAWSASDAATGYDGVLLRSCWDYHERPAEFLAWLDGLAGAGVPVWNAPATVRWNVDKRYLLDLADAGVPVVPTRACERVPEADELSRLSEELGAPRLVVKPVVGATAHGCRLLDTEATGSDAALEASEGSDDVEGPWLVQPFVEAIRDRGEWSLVWLAGGFSHAVVKLPAPGDYRVQAEWGGSIRRRRASSALVSAAGTAIDALAAPPLYARVDLVETPDGPLLMELELIEPELFLTPGAPRLGAFVEELVRLLGSGE